MGLEAKGEVLAVVMLEAGKSPSRYRAETRLLDILSRQRICSTLHLTVQGPAIAVSMVFNAFLKQRTAELKLFIAFLKLWAWNLKLLAASLFVACLGVMPYIHFSILHRTAFPILTLFFPFCRVVGGLLCIVPGQILLQYRIEMILKQRVLFKGINELLHKHDLKIPTPSVQPWDEYHTSEACLSSFRAFLKAASTGTWHTSHFIEDLAELVDSEPTGPDVAKALHASLTHTWTWLALISAVLCGFFMTIIGYVGCFTIVQSSSFPSDTYIWLGLEATLAFIRLCIWAWNPAWDDPPGILLQLDPENRRPLQSTSKFPDDLPQIYKTIDEDKFWDDLIAYSGPLNTSNMKPIHGFQHLYSWIRWETEGGAREVVCIILTGELGTVMCTINGSNEVKFHQADITSTHGYAWQKEELGRDHALVNSSEFKLNVFEHYSFIMSAKDGDRVPIQVSWPLLEFS
jgi:hypothetical protein